MCHMCSPSTAPPASTHTICKRHISRLVFQAKLYIKSCRFCYCHYCRHIFMTCLCQSCFAHIGAYGRRQNPIQLSHTGTSLFWFPAAHCLFAVHILFVCLFQLMHTYTVCVRAVLPQKFMHLSKQQAERTKKQRRRNIVLFVPAISCFASQSPYYLYMLHSS